MRVLMTADPLGGVWSYALDLANGLAELGVATTLAVTGGALSAAMRSEVRRSAVERCYAADFALEWMPDPWRDVARTKDWLLEIERDVNPDLVHLNSFAYGTAGFQAPIVMVAHSCVPSWFEACRGHAAPPEWDRYRAAVAAGLREAGVIVAPTRAMLEAFTRHHPVTAETRVIPNGVPPVVEPAAKEEVVLAAGRFWDEAKNLAALARVAPRLPWPVEVAGEGSPPGTSLRALGRLGRDELRSRMARARVFCAPTRYEPFGLAPVEAAQAGCALVLGDIPSLREVWGEAALYAPPEDDDAFAAAIGRAMHEPELATRARARALELTPDRMAAGYVETYERVLANLYEREAVRA
jgi:glycosyltransferase involved in cell wall biosynthesis